MKLSVVIPAHNEQDCVESTVRALHVALTAEKIVHELLIVNDNSTDQTPSILHKLQAEIAEVRFVDNCPPHGFGYAVRCGLDEFSGDAVAIVMADASDRPQDLIRYYRTMIADHVDCVFGSRFAKDATVHDYPRFKLFINRSANLFIRLLFGFRYNDITNAFKLYSRSTIDNLRPFLSPHFNLTVELPLKAIVRGHRYSVVPSDWINRKSGVSKLKLKEMGSRYLFIVLYCFIEKWLAKGDYKKSAATASEIPRNEDTDARSPHKQGPHEMSLE